MLATLLDRSDGDPVPLGAELTRRYGGELTFPARRPWVFANFVESIDGVVSLATPGHAHASVISAGNADDRFLLALLRVVADAVVVGAGTLRQEPASIWTAEHVLPELAADFAAARSALGIASVPLTVLITRSGELDLGLPVFRSGHPVLILTSATGAARLGALPPNVRARTMVDGTPGEIAQIAVAESGGSMILTEGGPTVLGEFLRARELDELFVTIAPRIAGRDARVRRLALVEGAAFGPDEMREMKLVSVKAAHDYLFTRFAAR